MQFEWHHICGFLGGQHVAAALQVTRWILTARSTCFDGTFCLHLQTGQWHLERREWSEPVRVSLKPKRSVSEVTEQRRNETEESCDLFRSWTKICVGKSTRNCIQYFLTVVLFTFCTCCILRCLVCIVVSCIVCIVVVFLCVLLSSYVYLLYYVCIVVFTLDAGLLARSQYSEGPATGHLDTGFFLVSLCL